MEGIEGTGSDGRGREVPIGKKLERVRDGNGWEI